ncbi:MAG: hypothetical protein U0556_06040 [Dehalococcoidia bacterium]
MTAWKLEPTLRGRTGGDVAIAVQPLAIVDPSAVEMLGRFGLQPPATPGGLWNGTVDVGTLAEIAALEIVGYIHDASTSAGSGVATTRRSFVPPTPAKRGHTKLPPRRE